MFQTRPMGKAVLPLLSLLTLFSAGAKADDAKPPIALPDDAANVTYNAASGSLEFQSPTEVKPLAEFFSNGLKKQGWALEPMVINKDTMVVMDLSKADVHLELTLIRMGDHTEVTGDGDALMDKAAASADTNADADAKPADATAENGNTLLTFTDKDGLPVPNEGVASGSEQTLFRHSISATVAAKISVVVDMYRKELSAKGWKEISDKTKIADDQASVTFDTPNGPALLTVKRDGNDTSLQLGISDKTAAAKSPLFPKAGQVKIALGNITEKTATVKIGGKSVKVPAGAGTKAPDGPTIDIAPGTIKAEMQGVQSETIAAGPDQIWMIMVGPGGLLPVQAY